MDKRPKFQWRLSSPVTIPVHDFQSLIVKSIDWKKSKISKGNGTLMTASTFSMTVPYVDMLSDCSSTPIISINKKKEEPIFQRKIISEGQLTEIWKIKAECNRNGKDCQQDFDESIQVKCKKFTFNNEVKFMDNSLDTQLHKVNIINEESKNLEFCCRNSSTLIEVYGNSNVGLEILKNDCIFSDTYEEKSKLYGVKTFFKICQVGNFIIKESFWKDQFNNYLAICHESDYVCT